MSYGKKYLKYKQTSIDLDGIELINIFYDVVKEPPIRIKKSINYQKILNILTNLFILTILMEHFSFFLIFLVRFHHLILSWLFAYSESFTLSELN
jgi:hypothetical protein